METLVVIIVITAALVGLCIGFHKRSSSDGCGCSCGNCDKRHKE